MRRSLLALLLLLLCAGLLLLVPGLSRAQTSDEQGFDLAEAFADVPVEKAERTPEQAERMAGILLGLEPEDVPTLTELAADDDLSTAFWARVALSLVARNEEQLGPIEWSPDDPAGMRGLREPLEIFATVARRERAELPSWLGEWSEQRADAVRRSPRFVRDLPRSLSLLEVIYERHLDLYPEEETRFGGQTAERGALLPDPVSFGEAPLAIGPRTRELVGRFIGLGAVREDLRTTATDPDTPRSVRRVAVLILGRYGTTAADLDALVAARDLEGGGFAFYAVAFLAAIDVPGAEATFRRWAEDEELDGRAREQVDRLLELLGD